MNRRTFNHTLAGALLGGLPCPHSFAAQSIPATNNSDNAAAPFKLSVMLWTVFTDLPFEQRLEKVAEAGYRNVELVGEFESWSEADYRRANAKRRQLGMSFDCTAGLKNGVSIPNQRPALLAELRRMLVVMDKLECPSIILLSGDNIPGAARELQHRCCIETLKAGAQLVEGKFINGQPVRLLLETIDPEENPKYFLTEIAEALSVVQAVNHPQVQLLYDFYHEQITAGNLIAKLEKSIPHLGLVHIADVPGRHQPGTGEINYGNIYRKLAELNYAGVVAMEFYPTGDPVAQLRSARQMAAQAIARP